jgi:hypothetical protein
VSEQRETPGTLHERRVSTVAGHRLCASCGFALLGQPILREPHYEMLIIRCPECGTVAAVQEYPALGRWAGRWAALLAALWLFVLVVAVFASAGLLFGMSQGMLEEGSRGYAEEIARAHDQWYRALPDPKNSPVTQYMPTQSAVSAYSWVDSSWWEGVDKAAFLEAQGGGFGAIDPRAMWFLGWVALAGVVVGVFWSVALLGQRRSRAIVLVILVVALAAGFAWMANATSDYSWMGGGVTYAAWAARAQLAPYVEAIALLAGAVAAAAGIWFGRPLARLAVRTLLPPHLRPSLHVLWLADGLTPPRLK